jgi:hypothetical protein
MGMKKKRQQYIAIPKTLTNMLIVIRSRRNMEMERNREHSRKP